MSTYTGDLGSISRGGVALIEVLSWAMSGASSAAIEDTAKGDVVQTFRPGRKNSGTITARCMIDLGNTAQSGWWDDVTDGVLATTNTVVATMDTGRTFTFQAVPTGAEAESVEGDGISSVTLTAQITGTVTTAWA